MRADAIARYREGASLNAVAQEFGMSASTILRWLREAGVETRPATTLGVRSKRISDEDRARTVELYKAGYSLSEVGAMMMLAPSAVHTRLRREGVRLRPRGQHRGADGRQFPGHEAMDATVLLYRSGLSSTEVAGLLGISPTTVRYRLQRAGVLMRTSGESLRLRFARRPKKMSP